MSTRRGGADQVVTDGGRVLCVTALGADIEAARARAYEAYDRIRWDGKFCRRDIGLERPRRSETAAIADAVSRPPVPLSENDIAALVAFLEALSDPVALAGRLGIPDKVPSGLPVER